MDKASPAINADPKYTDQSPDKNDNPPADSTANETADQSANSPVEASATERSTEAANEAKKTTSQGSQGQSEGFFKLFGRLMRSKQPEGNASKSDKLTKLLDQYNVPSLPQKFVVKQLGTCPSQKLGGLKHVKEYVDTLLEGNKKKKELPTAEIEVNYNGVVIVPREQNTPTPGTEGSPGTNGPETIPIEFISYGVQDSRHPKMFAFFRVRELSMRNKKTECYVFKCDSNSTCKKLALSLALSFREYGKSHKGQPHQFKVDLNQAELDESETIFQSQENISPVAEVDA